MKTKRGLMTQFPYARGRRYVCKNIGDYIQAIATKQFVNPVDEYIEQEEANMYYPEDAIPIRLVMNGWFQWRAENWPPSEFIKPLLISMHISPLKTKELLSPAGIKFFMDNAPVGCRDRYTESILKEKGIPSYFSGCMTLTLGEKYSVPPEEKKGICIVDPYFEIPAIRELIDNKKRFRFRNALQGLWKIFKHYSVVRQLGKKEFFKVYSSKGFLDRSKSRIRPYYKAAVFYDLYRKKFNKKLLLTAEYITHWTDVKMDGSVTNVDLLNYAESLIKKYASSKLVITSRIHAGLPCLGVETPVIFIANEQVVSEKGSFNTPGRLGGLLELFRVLTIRDASFSSDDDFLQDIDIIDEDSNMSNKTDWRKLAKDLKKRVMDFMK